jgi:hypothetical protein
MHLSTILLSTISLASAAGLEGARAKPHNPVKAITLTRKHNEGGYNAIECAFCYKKCPFLSAEGCTSCKTANCGPLIRATSSPAQPEGINLSELVEHSAANNQDVTLKLDPAKCEVCITLCLGGPPGSCQPCGRLCKQEKEILKGLETGFSDTEINNELDASLASILRCSESTCVQDAEGLWDTASAEEFSKTWLQTAEMASAQGKGKCNKVGCGGCIAGCVLTFGLGCIGCWCKGCACYNCKKKRAVLPEMPPPIRVESRDVAADFALLPEALRCVLCRSQCSAYRRFEVGIPDCGPFCGEACKAYDTMHNTAAKMGPEADYVFTKLANSTISRYVPLVPACERGTGGY